MAMAKDINQLKKDLLKLQNEIKAFPKKAAFIVENYTHKAFSNKKWDGVSWKERKTKDSSDRKNPDKPRALMVKTRTLQKSINVTSTPNSVVISSNVKYAKAHNEGEIINHPGGTPYLPFGSRFTARKQRGKISNMKDKQMIFIKKSQMAKFPQAQITKAHKIPMPKRQFMGYSKELILELQKEIDRLVKEAQKK